MAAPDYQSLMLPLLRFAAQRGGETSNSEAVEFLAKELQLSETDLKEMLPSGIQSTITNRIGWAATYMKRQACWMPPEEAFIRSMSVAGSFSRANPGRSM